MMIRVFLSCMLISSFVSAQDPPVKENSSYRAISKRVHYRPSVLEKHHQLASSSVVSTGLQKTVSKGIAQYTAHWTAEGTTATVKNSGGTPASVISKRVARRSYQGKH